jgi:hypothetical protein
LIEKHGVEVHLVKEGLRVALSHGSYVRGQIGRQDRRGILESQDGRLANRGAGATECHRFAQHALAGKPRADCEKDF